jgi:hypothetical protein
MWGKWAMRVVGWVDWANAKEGRKRRIDRWRNFIDVVWDTILVSPKGKWDVILNSLWNL